VRWVSATNRNISDLIQDKKLREDLFYRLNVLPIWIPPLRERIEDLEDLIEVAQKKLALKHQVDPICVDQNLLRKFRSYDWPGNIRELENTLEKMMILRTTQVEIFWEGAADIELQNKLSAGGDNLKGSMLKQFQAPFGITMEELNNNYMEAVLEHFAGNKEKAAELMGVHVRTIYRKKSGRISAPNLPESEI